MKKIINVEPLEDYKLLLTFDDNVKKIKDMKPYLDKGVFKTLCDKKVFNNVKIVLGSIVGEISICILILCMSLVKQYKLKRSGITTASFLSYIYLTIPIIAFGSSIFSFEILYVSFSLATASFPKFSLFVCT